MKDHWETRNIQKCYQWVSATGTASIDFAQFSVAKGKKAATRFTRMKRTWAAREGAKKMLESVIGHGTRDSVVPRNEEFSSFVEILESF